MNFEMKVIAHIESDFKEKFGIPRQSGYSDNVKSRIIFEKEYRVREAFRGLEDYSHIWILWQFSEAVRAGESWSPTVRPPRLGGNTRMGVFATRSPFRPNSVGLSSVKLEKVKFTEKDGPVLTVSGADLLDGTPIFDIKPYLAYTDSHPDAKGGFSKTFDEERAEVIIPEALKAELPEEVLSGLTAVLEQDPRPAYHDIPGRVYGMEYAGLEVKFEVEKGVVRVVEASSKNSLIPCSSGVPQK